MADSIYILSRRGANETSSTFFHALWQTYQVLTRKISASRQRSQFPRIREPNRRPYHIHDAFESLCSNKDQKHLGFQETPKYSMMSQYLLQQLIATYRELSWSPMPLKLHTSSHSGSERNFRSFTTYLIFHRSLQSRGLLVFLIPSVAFVTYELHTGPSNYNRKNMPSLIQSHEEHATLIANEKRQWSQKGPVQRCSH